MYGQPAYPQQGYGQPMYGQPQPVVMQPGFQPGFQQPGFQQPAFQGGYQQPGFHAPQQGPTVIHINNDDDDGTPCQFCGAKTSHITRRKVGCVAISWSVCLFLTTTVLCCWIPCCMDGCKDVELVCVKCQSVKGTIPANCC